MDETKLLPNESNQKLEDSVKKLIIKIRNSRSRPNYKNILNHLNRAGNNIDMPYLKEFLDDLENRGIITNKGTEGIETFYISDQPLINIQDGDHASEVLETTADLQTFIDDKFFNLIHDKIILEVDYAIKRELASLKSVCVSSDCSENLKSISEKDVLIDTLNSDIDFLRNEVINKDKIIEILIKEKHDCINNVNTPYNIKNIAAVDDINKAADYKTSTKGDDNNRLNLNTNANNIIEICDQQNDVNDFIKVESNKKRNGNKRSITIIGDSVIKDIKSYKMRKTLFTQDKIYIKSFPGATTEDMKDYIKPTLKYKPNMVILHMGTNSLRSNKTAEEIATDITNLAIEAKTDDNEVIISSIVPRTDDMKLNEKRQKVNDFLKIKSPVVNISYLENDNIKLNYHLNGSGVHLNFKGTIALANNFLNVIKI